MKRNPLFLRACFALTVMMAILGSNPDNSQNLQSFMNSRFIAPLRITHLGKVDIQDPSLPEIIFASESIDNFIEKLIFFSSKEEFEVERFVSMSRMLALELCDIKGCVDAIESNSHDLFCRLAFATYLFGAMKNTCYHLRHFRSIVPEKYSWIVCMLRLNLRVLTSKVQFDGHSQNLTSYTSTLGLQISFLKFLNKSFDCWIEVPETFELMVVYQLERANEIVSQMAKETFV